MSHFTVRPMENSERGLWQTLWEQSGGALAHHWNWAEWAAAEKGAPVRYGVFSRGGELLAGIPFVSRRRRGIPCLRHPAPLPWAGMMAREENLASESFRRDALAELAKAAASDALFADIIFQPTLEDVRGLLWNGWQARPHYNYVSFIDEEGALERQAENAVRRQAAKARAAGLTFETGREALLEDVLALWDETRRRQGVEAYVDDECYRQMVRGCAELEADQIESAVMVLRDPNSREALAGSVLVADRRRVYYLLGGTSENRGALGTGAPSLLQFDATDRLFSTRGAFTYDWIGANTQSVAQFKKKFRPALELSIRTIWTTGAGRLLRP